MNATPSIQEIVVTATAKNECVKHVQTLMIIDA